MKLISFRIKNYKVIDDTERVKVDARVTSLVGKNESGKTAVLKAMWKSRNVADVHFDKLYDYPRKKYRDDRKGAQEVTILEFKLSSEEAEDFAASFRGHAAPTPERIIYTTSYDGEDRVSNEVQFDIDITGAAAGSDARGAIEDVSSIVATQEGEDVDTVNEAAVSAVDQIDLTRIIQEGSDFGRKTKASAWYKWLAHRHLPTTEALT